MSEKVTFEKLKKWFLADKIASQGWRQKARIWFNLDAGEQWGDEDRELLEDQNRPVVTFNMIGPKNDSVCGMEVNNRHEVTFVPRAIGAAAVNEKLTEASRWVREQCDAEDEESQMVRDALICGLGATETFMDYQVNPKGDVKISRVDPNEFYWHHKSRKPNISDCDHIFRVKRIPKEEAQELFPEKDIATLHAGWAEPSSLQGPSHELTPVGDYGKEGTLPYEEQKGTVIVEAQWWERQKFWYIEDPQTGQMKTLSDKEYKTLTKRLEKLRQKSTDPAVRDLLQPFEAIPVFKKVFKRAFLGMEELKREDSPCAESFTYKFLTFKVNRNTGEPYGLVKSMEDPQQWANKWLAQTMHIMNTNPKGGVYAEEDAVDNWAQFETSWSDPSAVTKVAPGAIQGGKLQPKPAPVISPVTEKLTEFAIGALDRVTGINADAIGLADRVQPGILEHMRKQSMMTVLAPFFANLRKYRKEQGRLLLHFIQEYLSDGRLIRLGQGQNAQYVPLIKDPDTAEYDVIVDESPTAPSQKEYTWTVISQMLPLLTKMPVPPDLWLEIIRYSPLPASLSEKMMQIVKGAIEQSKSGTQAMPFKPTVSIDKLLEHGSLTVSERAQLLAKIGIKQDGTGQPGLPQPMPPKFQ